MNINEEQYRKTSDARAFVASPHGATVLTPFSNLTSDGLDRVRRMYAHLAPNRETLAVLFALQAAQTAPTDEWTSFFVETGSAQLIWDERPTGTLSEDDAHWLLARFDEAPSIAVMGLLVRVLEEAHRSPGWFPASVRQRAALFRPVSTQDGSTTLRSAAHLRLVA